VRTQGDYVYWLVRDPQADSDLFELRRRSTFANGAYELLARERGARDFAVDAAFAYLTRWLSTGYGVEVIAVHSISEKLHLGLSFELTYPESVGPLFWFYDSSRGRVQQVDLGLGDLPE
jgi:hypothetical protein